MTIRSPVYVGATCGYWFFGILSLIFRWLQYRSARLAGRCLLAKYGVTEAELEEMYASRSGVFKHVPKD